MAPPNVVGPDIAAESDIRIALQERARSITSLPMSPGGVANELTIDLAYEEEKPIAQALPEATPGVVRSGQGEKSNGMSPLAPPVVNSRFQLLPGGPSRSARRKDLVGNPARHRSTVIPREWASPSNIDAHEALDSLVE